MGRPAKNRVRTHIAVEQDVFAELELILTDPKKGGFLYGALSEITNRLYRKWLDTMQQPGVDPIKYLEAYGVELKVEASDSDSDVNKPKEMETYYDGTS